VNRQRPKKALDVTSLVAPVGDPQGMRARMAEFLEWMQVRHYTDSYVISRAKCLDAFAAWAEDRGLEKPADVTKPVWSGTSGTSSITGRRTASRSPAPPNTTG
jgi:hypothetical protein